ncbi:MAG: endonuclease III domain-containing protein [Vicinamibacteraceae bacterium]
MARCRIIVTIGALVMLPTAAPIDRTLRTLKKAILSMELPAIEKISEEQEGDAFQVLIGTMLSAQTRDPVTHEASTRLFAVAPSPGVLARLPLKRIERLIYPVSFYRNKARHVKAASRQIMEKFGGRIPATMEELLTLPGVGRKTATLTLIVAHESADYICVDTHVHRIANRFGWVRTKTPEQTELALYDAVPKRWWADVNLFLVSWGQNVCKPVYPLCRTCPLDPLCPKIGVGRQGAGVSRRQA